MKKSLVFILIGAIAGTAVAFVFTKIKRKVDIEKKETRIAMPNNNIYLHEFDNCKASTIQNIADRHKDAAIIIQNSVEKIINRSNISEFENQELDNISNELNNLLMED